MSTISEDTIRTKKDDMQKINMNAEVTDVRCSINYTFEWEGNVKNAFSGRYMSMYGEWPISEEKANKCIKKTNNIDIIKQKHQKQNKLNQISKYKDVDSSVYMNAKIFYKISYFNGGSIWASESVKITENNYISCLLSYIKNTNKDIYADEMEDSICVVFDEFESILTKEDEPSESMTDMEEFLLKYLSNTNKWVNCVINDIETYDNNISIPISIENTSIEFRYSNPQDNKSSVWDFVNEFNYDSIWDLQGEEAQICIKMISNDSYCTYEFLSIRQPINPARKKINDLRSRISNIIN